jgi:DNA modification methylase
MGWKIRTADGTIKRSLINKTSGRRRENATRTQIEARASQRRNDLVPEQSVELMPIEMLQPAARRARKKSLMQTERLTASILEYGFVGAILVRGQQIVDGHERVAAMKALCQEEIPTIDVSYLDGRQIEALSISMNRIAETGEWDMPVLHEILVDLDKAGFDLIATGFSEQEADIILMDDKGEEAEDLPDLGEIEPITQLGDIWELNGHRLLCGDSLDARNYERLLEGGLATAAFTDMPYNVKIEGNVSGHGKVKHGEFQMASGEMSSAEFEAFMVAALALIALNVMSGGVIFSCMDWRHDSEMVLAARSIGLNLLNKCIWDKGTGGMGGFYRSRHEIVAVFSSARTPSINNIALGRHGRDRSNVWSYPGANSRGSSAAKVLQDHPTPKNVEMVADAILDVTHRGDIVLDPFMGSGTTIMAAEKTGRRAYGLELEPRFVDLAVRRWEIASGRRAVRIPAPETE